MFCIAGLLHTERPLGVPRLAKLGALCLVLAIALRLAPNLGIALPGPIMAWRPLHGQRLS
ncbi:MAG: hypothetical protein KDJ88_02560 [Bauldia sp.]|nr:hypothetical protein [Bauldia sp.]